MTHETYGAVIQLPDMAPQDRRIDARRAFCRRRPGHRGWLWTVDLDGTRYLTDRCVTLRADRLEGLNDTEFDQLNAGPRNVDQFLSALTAPLARREVTDRFDLHTVVCLNDAGCGVMPLENAGDIHAIVFLGTRVGLMRPIPETSSAHRLGVIPGAPPAAAELDWMELAR
jgi:hypothetical protein